MRSYCLLLALSLLTACSAAGGLGPDDDDDTAATEPEFVALPDVLSYAFGEETEDSGAPGSAIAIWHDGTLYAQGFGSRRPGEDDVVLPSTLFRIGSVTKMMTATALLQKVDQGALALDDTLGDYVPSLSLLGAADPKTATLHDLLSHQGGLSDYTPMTGGPEDERLAEATLSEFPNKAWVMAPPGSFWNYSNPNFSMAGLVTEVVDEQRWYREIVEDDLFAPLGMDRSVFLADQVIDDGDYAVGLSYDWEGKQSGLIEVHPDSYDDAWSRPAGFAWSNVLDLVRFGRFLLDGNEAVLSEQSHTELTAEHVNTLAFLDRLHYGYGLMQWNGAVLGDDFFNVRTIQHGGAIPGFAAELITLPEHGLVIATLASAGGLYFKEAVAATLTELVGLDESDFPDLEADPSDFGAFVGSYEDPYNVGTIEVQQTGDDLVVSMPDLDALSIPYSPVFTPHSRGNFIIEIQGWPVQVTFVAEEPDESPRWFRTRHFVAERVDDEDSAARSAPPRSRRSAQVRGLRPSPLN